MKNCDFCFIGDDLNPEKPKQYELTLEHFEKIRTSRFYKNALRLGLLGGEPFLAKDIFEILKILQKSRKIFEKERKLSKKKYYLI